MRRKASGDHQFSFPSPIEYHANKTIDRTIETKGLSFSFIVSRSVQTHDRKTRGRCASPRIASTVSRFMYTRINNQGTEGINSQ